MSPAAPRLEPGYDGEQVPPEPEGTPARTTSRRHRRATGGTPPAAGASQAAPSKSGTEGGEPVLPARSPDDEDTGWGDAPSGNEERLVRDVPPHW